MNTLSTFFRKFSKLSKNFSKPKNRSFKTPLPTGSWSPLISSSQKVITFRTNGRTDVHSSFDCAHGRKERFAQKTLDGKINTTIACGNRRQQHFSSGKSIGFSLRKYSMKLAHPVVHRRCRYGIPMSKFNY